MLSDIENIGRYIKDIAGSGGKYYSVLGFVDEVDEETMTCQVTAFDKSYTYYNVRLKEITLKENIEDGCWFVPIVNSRVVISCISPSEAYVSMVSEVSKVYYKVSDLIDYQATNLISYKSKDFTYVADNEINYQSSDKIISKATNEITHQGGNFKLVISEVDGFRIYKDGGEDLKSLIEELISILETFQVNTAWGPSGPPFGSIPTQLGSIKTRFGQLFKT